MFGAPRIRGVIIICVVILLATFSLRSLYKLVSAATNGGQYAWRSSDKVIVMTSLQADNTSWVQEELSDWSHALYIADCPAAWKSQIILAKPGHRIACLSRNKGREAQAYLAFIIESYDNLPNITVFLHPHRSGYPEAWHNDNLEYSNVLSLQKLRLDFVEQEGYVNLRCNPDPGCPVTIRPVRTQKDQTILADPQAAKEEVKVEAEVIAKVWKDFFGLDDEEGGTSRQWREIPETIGTPCCAQFAVTREEIKKRPKKDYERYLQWLLNTELEDRYSGRVFEFLWHIIFGRESVCCPNYLTCQCNLYGMGCPNSNKTISSAVV